MIQLNQQMIQIEDGALALSSFFNPGRDMRSLVFYLLFAVLSSFASSSY